MGQVETRVHSYVDPASGATVEVDQLWVLVPGTRCWFLVGQRDPE